MQGLAHRPMQTPNNNMPSSSSEVRRRKNTKNSNKDDDGSSKPTQRTQHTNQIKNTRKIAQSNSSPRNHTANGSSSKPSNSKSKSNKRSNRLPNNLEEYVWSIVFLSAFLYFIITRTGLGSIESQRYGLLSSFSKPYRVVSSNVWIVDGKNGDKQSSGEELLKSIFFVAKVQQSHDGNQSSLHGAKYLTLVNNRRLEVILSSPFDILSIDDAAKEKQCASRSTTSIQATPYLSHILSTTWVHDEELGRGYLLLADAGRSGRIWRWEVGGGPITIGRSLHMERSGCRSGKWVDRDDYFDSDGSDEPGGNATCPENLFGKWSSPIIDGHWLGNTNQTHNSTCKEIASTMSTTSTSSTSKKHISFPPLMGSSFLAVELTRNANRPSNGKNLLVAEWGERRIVRVEGKTGARTPIVTLVPTKKGSNGANSSQDEGCGVESAIRRVYRPGHLTYTPFGDLLFSDNYPASKPRSEDNIGTIYRLKEAVHVPPISAEHSREAHGWETTSNTTNMVNQVENKIDVIFQTNGWIEGMALGGSDFSILYVMVANTVKKEDNITVPLGESSFDWKKTVFKLSLNAEDEDDEEEEDAGGAKAAEIGNAKTKLQREEVSVFYQMKSSDCHSPMTSELSQTNEQYSFLGSKLAIDEKGTVYIISCPSSVTLLAEQDEKLGSVVGNLSIESPRSDPIEKDMSLPSAYLLNSVNFGEDGYLYVTTSNQLMRIMTRVGGIKLPTDMVPPPPLKAASKT